MPAREGALALKKAAFAAGPWRVGDWLKPTGHSSALEFRLASATYPEEAAPSDSPRLDRGVHFSSGFDATFGTPHAASFSDATVDAVVKPWRVGDWLKRSILTSDGAAQSDSASNAIPPSNDSPHLDCRLPPSSAHISPGGGTLSPRPGSPPPRNRSITRCAQIARVIALAAKAAKSKECAPSRAGLLSKNTGRTPFVSTSEKLTAASPASSARSSVRSESRR